jgi:hypothetical protein
MWVAKETFASGEVAEKVYGVVSSAQFQAGCIALTNALLTSTGSARKRFGTEDIASTTGGHTAALFSYVSGARRFVIQFVSQDDDAGDLNTAQRQVRVLDAETRAFIAYGDGVAHGIFAATGSNDYYYHHFTASQLPEVYAVQDGTRIVFFHKDRPPLYMERAFGPSGEQWLYGIVAKYGAPKVVDYTIPASITVTSDTATASSDLFHPDDVGTFWRLGGAEPINPVASPWGAWWQTSIYKSPREIKGAIIHGTMGADPTDWTGPYVSGGGVACSISSSSSTVLDSRSFTFSGTAWQENHRGTPFLFTAASIPSLWIITSITSATVFVASRLWGSGTVSGSGTGNLYVIGYNPASFDVLARPFLRGKHALYPTGTTGTIGIRCIEPLLYGGAASGYKFLPDGHETTFTKDGSDAVGGVVHLNGGSVAITSSTNSAGGYYYTGNVTRPLKHQGPTLHWGLSWSHGTGFPRCGVFHQSRLIAGGFESFPKSIIGSRVGSPQDFSTGPNAADGFLFELTDPTGGTPVWMESAGDLRIGTTTSEGVIAGAPLTPTNVSWERQTGYGGNNVRPILVGSSVLFGSAHGLREQEFVQDQETYLARDLTDIATHLFGSHIKAVEYLNHPLQTAYVLLESGEMRALSYWKENNVIGWSPFTQPVYPTNSGAAEMTSVIESMAAIRYGGSIADDELWLVRRFTSGGQSAAGSTVRRIERMAPAFTMDQSWTDTTPSATEVGNAPHLLDLSQAAHKAGIVLDDVYIGDAAVGPTGTATFPDVGTTPTEGVMGRKIRFEMVPLIPQPPDREGVTQGRKMSVVMGNILLIGSKGGTISGKRINLENVPNQVSVMTPVSSVTGWRPVPGIGEYGIMAELEIVQDTPYQFEVAALSLQVKYGA